MRLIEFYELTAEGLELDFRSRLETPKQILDAIRTIRFVRDQIEAELNE